MEGWIKISRNINTHWIWENAEYLKWWLDLILLAEYEDKKRLVRSHLTDVKRGQAVVSVRSLQQRWARKDEDGNIISMPSLDAIHRFLKLLERDEMICRVAEHSKTLLTICNYAKYQDEPTTTPNTSRTLAEQLPNTSRTLEQRERKEAKEREIGKVLSHEEVKEEIENANASKKTASVFKRPTEEEVQAYIREKGYYFDAAQFCDFYESKGWKVGSSPMKDWRAAVRNWARRDASRTAPTTPQRTTPNGIVLGVGEFIDPTGRRTYGTGLANIPAAAPPRPSSQYAWNAENQSWIIQ